ncbi:MAG: sodium/glutamate symporter [Myxococcales bacterium]|nr:sodium/glutamate symporter [Myxococcales bacterium]MCB9709477.1 sodium/glutamate symporter [Myxococcales bacterium]
MTISPWILLLLAVPVLLLGEALVRHIGVLSRFNIPAPVAGGLSVCVLILFANLAGVAVTLEQRVDETWWNWLVLTEIEAAQRPMVDVIRPFLVAFFVCIGLNASWGLVKRASWQLPLFCAISGLLAILQNALGMTVATLLGESPLLGLLCGSISLTGGHGTAIGFSDVIVAAGYPSAAVVGIASATFGLVAAGLLGGPVGGRLMRVHELRSTEPTNTHPPDGGVVEVAPSGLIGDIKALGREVRPTIAHLLIIALCIKLGAWVSFGMTQLNLTFPVYIGAMLVGVAIRNICYATGIKWINTRIIDLWGSVFLGIFLSMAMMALNLIELANTAGSMIVILALQVIMMAAFAYFVTYRVMGQDYDAAVMSAGHCGFGLGATPAAVANMKTLVEKYGAAPRAFLIIPLVGAFLIDFINSLIITGYLNFFG